MNIDERRAEQNRIENNSSAVHNCPPDKNEATEQEKLSLPPRPRVDCHEVPVISAPTLGNKLEAILRESTPLPRLKGMHSLYLRSEQLRVLEGFDYGQIATCLDVKENHIKQILHRGRSALAQEMGVSREWLKKNLEELRNEQQIVGVKQWLADLRSWIDGSKGIPNVFRVPKPDEKHLVAAVLTSFGLPQASPSCQELVCRRTPLGYGVDLMVETEGILKREATVLLAAYGSSLRPQVHSAEDWNDFSRRAIVGLFPARIDGLFRGRPIQRGQLNGQEIAQVSFRIDKAQIRMTIPKVVKEKRIKRPIPYVTPETLGWGTPRSLIYFCEPSSRNPMLPDINRPVLLCVALKHNERVIRLENFYVGEHVRSRGGNVKCSRDAKRWLEGKRILAVPMNGSRAVQRYSDSDSSLQWVSFCQERLLLPENVEVGRVRLELLEKRSDRRMLGLWAHGSDPRQDKPLAAYQWVNGRAKKVIPGSGTLLVRVREADFSLEITREPVRWDRD